MPWGRRSRTPTSIAPSRSWGESPLGRVVLVHLSIIAGMIAFAIFDEAWTFFAVFAGLKGLSDIAQFLPRARAVSA